MTQYYQNGRYLTKPAARMLVRMRDGHGCHICGEYVDERRPHGDPKQSTLDHIVESAAGGSSDIANTRLAHKACNEKRGVEFNRAKQRAAAG
jgi:5-methylcytosine-specific restriction endonuclease McrA